LLEIEKSGHFSDIEDYLPVIRIAAFKDFKSCILGINTSEIYEKYAIGNIKFLGIMNYLKSNPT